MIKKISKEKFIPWLNSVKGRFQILGPGKDKDIWSFGEWNGQDLSPDFLNTRLSPKGLFLEPLQPLFGWNSKGGAVQLSPLPPSGGARLIFGVRACDARAIRILEPVFAGNHPDGHYLGNLSRTILLGVACSAPCPGSFCREVGIDPQESADCDLFFRQTSSGKMVRIMTDRGKELAQGTDFFQEGSSQEWDSARREMREGRDRLPIELEKVKGRMAQRFKEDEFWQVLSAKCINCGACTYLCPTCHCFDISDLQVSGRGVRFRTWDSCAYSSFTRMPVHNPREEKWRRYRQRVAHKFYFFPQNFQAAACVGCGRCVAHCPANLDLRHTLLEVSR